MKIILILLSLVSASSLFGESWYGYCVAEQSEFRYCTRAELKLDNMEAKCQAFAARLGSRSYTIQSGTDLVTLESEMVEHCDSIKGPDAGAIYSCHYAKQCPHSTPKVSNFASRVYADSKAIAIEKCARQHETTIMQKLKESSVNNCFFKLLAELAN